MQKLLPLVFILLITHHSSLITALAETPFSRALADYQFNFGKYLETHDEYTLARNRYFAAPTLKNQELVFQASKPMLASRAETLETYFSALAIRFVEAKPLEPETLESVLDSLDSEREFLKGHQKKLQDSATPEELLNASRELEGRQGGFLLITQKTLGQILLPEEKRLLGQAEKLAANAENILERMEKDGEDITLLKTWLEKIKAQLAQARAKQSQAEVLILSLGATREKPAQQLSQAKAHLADANRHIRQAISFLFEFLREVKNA